MPETKIAANGLKPEKIVKAKRRYPPKPTNAC